MNLKIFIYLIFLAVFIAGCNNDKDADFCSCANTKNIDKTLPFVNEFLNGQTEWDYELRAMDLVKWLKSQPCIIDAFLLSRTESMKRSVAFSFVENGATKRICMDVSYLSIAQPLRIEGFREYAIPADDEFCRYINAENIDRIIPLLNEYMDWLNPGQNEERVLPEITAWLKSIPCILDADLIWKVGNTGEISFSFDKNGTFKECDLYILPSFPYICSIASYNDPVQTDLSGTSWRLAGIVETEIGNIKILPTSKVYSNCYKIDFAEKNWDFDELPKWIEKDFCQGLYRKATGRTSCNSAEYLYCMDDETGAFQIDVIRLTGLAEFPDGELYLDALHAVHSFSLLRGALRLYFEDNNKYLLFFKNN